MISEGAYQLNNIFDQIFSFYRQQSIGFDMVKPLKFYMGVHPTNILSGTAPPAVPSRNARNSYGFCRVANPLPLHTSPSVMILILMILE